MTANLERASVTLKLWLMVYLTSDVFRACMDRLFMEHNITSEQYDVLATIKYPGGHVNITDVAQWLGRSTNSVSMLVDRMVKAGLVKRVRDRQDRRVVYVLVTSKGENILELTSPACWEAIKEILSPLSYEERRTFLSLFEMVNYKALEYLNPVQDVAEIIRKRDKRHAELMKRVPSYVFSNISVAKRQSGKKGKTIR